MPECVACGQRLADLAVACPKCWTPTALGAARDIEPPVHGGHLRPEPRSLGTGDVIYSALRIYRTHVRPLLVLAALVAVPVQLLSALILAAAPDEADVFSEPPFFSRFPPPPAVDTQALWLWLVARLMTAGLGIVAIHLTVGVSFGAVGEAYAGRHPEWKTSVSVALQQLRSLLWLAVVPTVLIGVGLVLGLVPGMWLYACWAVAVPVLLAEREHGASALRRSVRLVRGHWWRVFGVIVLSRLIALTFGLIISSVLRLLGSFAGDGRFVTFVTDLLAGAAAQTLTAPFLAVTIAILYLDLRAPKEGLGVELEARQAASTAPQQVAEGKKKPRARPTVSRSKRASARTRAKVSPRRARKPPPARR